MVRDWRVAHDLISAGNKIQGQLDRKKSNFPGAKISMREASRIQFVYGFNDELP